MKSYVGRGLSAVVALVAAALLMIAAPAAAGASSLASSACPSKGHGAARVGRFGGIVHALPVRGSCEVIPASDAANGTPPLIFHGGPVMGTKATGPVVITPIFWTPAGHPIPADYENIITTYLAGVAAASGQNTNVYSTLGEYYGANGAIRYRIALGAPITDTSPLPTSGCKLSGQDQHRVYADNTGYDACLDDDQVIAETESVVTAHGLRRDYGHIYVMFLPKHVESCFFAGSTTTASNACTINHQPSAAYCAYHSQAPSGLVYANMPFPIYASPVGFTCSSDAVFPVVQSPNANPDADTEVSPTSHEVMESITDPDTVTGWYDSSGYENGDECAYVFGVTQGTPGQLYNQVIDRRHYLTQEEFSNRDFARTGGGCLQSG